MKRTNRGFSLMELLAVMAIMAILSTMAITGYFTAVRSMSRRRAVSNLMASLMQARQRACIEGARMALVCYNVKKDPSSSELKSVAPTYYVCKALGRVTSITGGQIGDEFTPLNKIFSSGSSASSSASSSFSSFGSRRLYNLSGGGWTDVGVTVEAKTYMGDLKSGVTGEPFQPPPELLWCFKRSPGGVDNAGWKIGDLYGIEVSPPGLFPKNVFFGSLMAGDKSQITVMFKPDGSAIGADIDVVAQDGKQIATINVSNTGEVTLKGNTVNLK